MDESKRKARNAARLAECFPEFRVRAARALRDMEAGGFRPRIQEAWRSPEGQLAAFNAGTSKLRFGFHNVTGPGGRRESLAIDVLDDDHPLNPGTRYLLRLAIAAAAAGLETGITWGLPANLVSGLEDAIQRGDDTAKVKVGWDPTHVQAPGLTPAEARHGVRPT